MNFDLNLKGRRALVTGGTKGVGAAVVAVLHQAGGKVLTTARSAPDATIAGGVLFVAADVSNAQGCTAVAQAVASQLGGIDIIVNVVSGSSAPGGGFAALDDDNGVTR